jgi:hypothetical protein
MEEFVMSRANPRFHRTNPPLPLVGAGNGVVQYVVQGVIEGQMTLSTFMYSAAVPNPTAAQLAQLLTNISTAIFPAVKGMSSADWTVVRELLKVVHRNDLATVTSTVHNGNPGGRPAGHAPTEVAGIMLRQTAVKGQHGRGRVSFPAVSLTDVSSSSWISAGIALAITVMGTAGLTTASDGTNTWTPCVGQRSNVAPHLIVGFAPIQAWTANVLLGTIRRRKIGRGK